MKKIIAVLFVLFLLLGCAAVSLLAAWGYFSFRTTAGDVLPQPPIALPAAPQIEILPPPTADGSLFPPGTAGGSGGGGFNGDFSGTLTANNGSTATASLSLSQSGEAVSGRLSIGEGLSIDAGVCGAVKLPAGSQDAAGTVDPANPNRLAAAVQVPAAGMTIVATLAAEVSGDGNTVAARVDIDLPFFCGRDGVIEGWFTK